MLIEAEQAAAQGPAPGGAAPTPIVATPQVREGFGTRLRGWLMTGVSYMIPFVAAGGIMIALAFLIGGAQVATKVNGGTFEGVTYPGIGTDLTKLWATAGIAGLLFKIGTTAFAMLIPILSGFIAFAMADRTGLVPGIVGGLIASSISAGFLGGLIAGLLAGTAAMWMQKLKVPRAVRGLMPVVVIPLVSTFVVGFLMLVVIGQPIASATKAMNDWLNGLSGSNAVLLGVILGAMMGFDLGGPVNKVAYAFGLAGLTAGNQLVMAAVMGAGMVAPLALALATVVRKRLFTRQERDAGESAWLLGASFISEGAIPFAAADPVRVIPAMVIGSAVTGALSMWFGAKSPAPHGGIWVVGLIDRPLQWTLSIIIGALVGAACVIVTKTIGRKEAAQAAEEARAESTVPVIPTATTA